MFLYMIFFLIMLTSIFFFSHTNPFLLSMSLLLISLLLFFPLGYWINSWFGMSIILIFSGGMMIIFLYMTSLSSNQKFFMTNKNFFPLFILILVPLVTPYPQINSLPLNFLFTNFNQKLIYFIFIYIMITLILVVNMSQHFLGTMKKTY